MHLTLRQINRFLRFLSQIKDLFFYFNRFFVKYLLSSLRACHWLIISDYFSSIFSMLNSHKKNGFCCNTVSPSRFWLNTSVFGYIMTYQMRTTLSRRCAFKKKFLTFWDVDKCYFFLDFLIYFTCLLRWWIELGDSWLDLLRQTRVLAQKGRTYIRARVRVERRN